MAVSFLLIEEYFASGDDRFADALREFHVAGSLATIADKWKKDPRPWARQQILKYLDLPLDAAAHETVVKRLFKHAEEARDDELVAAFAAAFDRLVRRVRRTRWGWDFRSRESWSEEVLRAIPDSLPTPSPSAKRGPVTPAFHSVTATDKRYRLFSHHTRCYLRRRAWRYLRRIGYSAPDSYPQAVARMLGRYRDEDFARGENILDSWGLLHACFGESEVLEFGASHARIHDGRSLGELTAAPMFPDTWERPDSGRVLLDLLRLAPSRLVRVWSIQLLRRDHAELFRAMPIADIRRLLEHPDEEIQILGAQVLEQSTELAKLPVSGWLELLNVRNPTVLETICRLMAQHVRSERLDLAQCVQLASAKSVPVARLGFGFLRDREIRTEAEREIIAQLADAQCPAIGIELARWALVRLGAADVYRMERVIRFFDSLVREVREGAWTWLTPESPGWHDSGLWSRLVETPYDDVRLHFVAAIQQRAGVPGVGAENLSSLWCAVLLGIHRGGRHKLIALRQISDALRNHPENAELLLPVVAVAIRSVRPSEARAGLAAVVAAVEARPELETPIGRVLPELELTAGGAAK